MTVIQFQRPGGFACETDAGIWQAHRQDLFQRVGFTDWLSIRQRHAGPLPKFSDGAVLFVDEHGEVRRSVLKREKIKGSHSSVLMIRCDGELLEFSGNVSRFNREDNVFGLTLETALEKVNAIVQALGLPPFTAGERFVSNRNGQPVSAWTGAEVRRLDVTENFATGSKDNASHFMRWLAEQQASRMKTGTYGDGETVDYGRGSKRAYFKVYYKATELRNVKHHEQTPYIGLLAKWADDVGLVRAELTLHPRKLADLGCQYLGGFNMKAIEAEFADKCAVFTRASATVEELPKLPKALLGSLRMWESGDDLVSKLPKATFYRHRAALLRHGIDIAIKSKVRKFEQRTRVITLGPAAVPEFYEWELEHRQ